MGADSGRIIGIGQRVTVRLAEAVPVTGGLMLELLELEGDAMPRPGPSKGRGRPVKRKATKAARKSDKVKRKVTRRRR